MEHRRIIKGKKLGTGAYGIVYRTIVKSAEGEDEEFALKRNLSTVDVKGIEVVRELLRYGARVYAYDPVASKNFRELFPKIEYNSSAMETVRGADACLVLTEWEEFRELTDQDFSGMREKIIIEGRKALNPNRVSGFEGVCW